VKLSAGTKLGPYEILAPLGAGGRGEVYRARDARPGREVAVKILPDDVAADPERQRRFDVEARSASSLNHPSIITIHDVGNQDGILFVVFELLEGETLRDEFALEALEAGATERNASERGRRSIAVLPFKNLARGSDDAHLGMALADATITELALVDSLLVRPTAAILRYRDRPVEPHPPPSRGSRTWGRLITGSPRS
jgi:hypothetical protein